MTGALLPEGLRDRLPPEAEAQARVMRGVLDVIAAHGYDRVAPPLAEYEDALAAQLKSARRQDLLRVVDPLSQRMLALRPDITAQVGRIAATSLAHRPRPLRLSYGGPVLKLKGEQLAPEREVVQLGAELIGRDSVAAAREIAHLAVEALAKAGARAITLDIAMPDIVTTLADSIWPVAPDARATLHALLDAKDAGGLVAHGFGQWLPLVDSAGPIARADDRLAGLAPVLDDRLGAIAAVIDGLGDVRITLDPAERHGFAYHSWFGFSLFADGVAGEIGRGGTYAIVHPDGTEEPATGLSLYPDALISRARHAPSRILFVPLGADGDEAARRRAVGWRTVAAMDEACDPVALGCTHRLDGLRAVAL